MCLAQVGRLQSFVSLLVVGLLLAQDAAFPQELKALLSDFLGSFCLRLAEACNLPGLRFPQIRDILPQSTERLPKRLVRLSERPGVQRHPWQRCLEETKRLLGLQILFRNVAGAIPPRRRPH
jgi:hypothetical protein